MQSQKNNYRLHDENSVFELALLSVIGNREEQQDSAGYQLKKNEGVVVVCDGMGGHEGGQIASTLATEAILKSYSEEYPLDSPHSWLLDMANETDKRIAMLENKQGDTMKAGSTIVSVFVRDHFLYWLSVGDSRIYLYRAGELVRATTDHNYKQLLDRQLDTGQINEEVYNCEIEQGEALVSFLGVNGLPFIESNDIAFELRSGDKILLTTDGLYRLLSDDGIKNIITNFENISDALVAMETKAQRCAANISRDNMTVALLSVK